MFPSEHDIDIFKADFGPESILLRIPIPGQSIYATQAAAVIIPEATKDATLRRAWESVRAIARWILAHGSELPASERYGIIVGWSRSVRERQGQIFKLVGDRMEVKTVADSESWPQCGRTPLIRWEKDVFVA
jgi:hypothetical protein